MRTHGEWTPRKKPKNGEVSFGNNSLFAFTSNVNNQFDEKTVTG